MDKRLLIIEDSKPIATIHRNIAKRIGLQAVVAYSLAQTKQIIAEDPTFFCAVIDYNLPDAGEGEAIDYVVDAGIPVIVMTGMTNKDVRNSILKRAIIDYIPKDNKQDYLYLQQLLGQLLRNEEIKVLVVDDSITSRNLVCNQLHRHNYQVYQAVDGVQALKMLEIHPDIKLVLTDQEMPNMDGITLTNQIRKTRSKEKLVIIGISGSMDNSLTARFLKNGANDYLHKPFCIEEFNCRLMHNIQYLENIETIRLQSERVEQRNRDIAVLSEIGREITASLDLELIHSKVYQHVNNIMDAYIFSIGIYREEEELIEFEWVIEGGEQLEGSRVAMSDDDRLAVWCIRQCKEIVIANREQALQYVNKQQNTMTKESPETMIFRPLLVHDRLIGCMSVQSLKKDAYSDHQLDMVRTIAASAAIALDNAEVHRKLKESQNQLVMQEKMASLGILTAGVAHEINNPTNFAHVSAQNLEVDLRQFKTFLYELAGDDADAEVLNSFNEQFDALFKHVATINDGTDRIKGIVRDLQAFTRHDNAGQKTVYISDCLQSTIKLVRAKYRETTEFIESFEINPQIECWPAQLNQVFMNLLVNACQAVAQKQLDNNALELGQVKVSTYREDNQLVIEFIDNGIGMDSVTQSKLFEPFFTTKEVGEGTGLGLSISFGIIRKHDGVITVNSAQGTGSTFAVKLPCFS